VRSVRRDGHEGADEIAESLADDPRARFDALRDVAIDTHARGVDEDAAVHLADVDDATTRAGEESRDVATFARITERAREIVPRPDRIERERGARSDQPVSDLIGRSVAADGDDGAAAIHGRLSRDARGLARRWGPDDLYLEARRLELAREAGAD